MSSVSSKLTNQTIDLFDGNDDFDAVWSKIAKTYKNTEKKNKAK